MTSTLICSHSCSDVGHVEAANIPAPSFISHSRNLFIFQQFQNEVRLYRPIQCRGADSGPSRGRATQCSASFESNQSPPTNFRWGECELVLCRDRDDDTVETNATELHVSPANTSREWSGIRIMTDVSSLRCSRRVSVLLSQRPNTFTAARIDAYYTH